MRGIRAGALAHGRHCEIAGEAIQLQRLQNCTTKIFVSLQSCSEDLTGGARARVSPHWPSSVADSAAERAELAQRKLMSAIGAREPATLGEVADAVGRGAPAVSRAVDTLVRAGLVERTQDPDNRRRLALRLSERGRDAAAPRPRDDAGGDGWAACAKRIARHRARDRNPRAASIARRRSAAAQQWGPRMIGLGGRAMILMLLVAGLSAGALPARVMLDGALAKDGELGVRAEAMLLGAVTNFFDTLGIGSFAPTIAWFQFRKLVPDRLIPLTMLVGHILPAILQGVIFLILLGVLVDPVLLVGCVVALIVGGMIGAPLVAADAESGSIQAIVGIALLIAAIFYALEQPRPDARRRNRDQPAAAADGRSRSSPISCFGILLNFGVGNYAPTLAHAEPDGHGPAAGLPDHGRRRRACRAPAASAASHAIGEIDLRIVLGLAARRHPGGAGRRLHRQGNADRDAALAGGGGRHSMPAITLLPEPPRSKTDLVPDDAAGGGGHAPVKAKPYCEDTVLAPDEHFSANT